MADNIEDIEELDEEAQQLYEHFRFVVDKGQERLRPRKGKGTRPSARWIPPKPAAEASPGR